MCKSEKVARAAADSWPEPLARPAPAVPASTSSSKPVDEAPPVAAASDGSSAGEGGVTNTLMLDRLTSTLAAEEVNELFEAYIESVPSFGAEAAYAAGFEDGYARGYEDALAARSDAAPARVRTSTEAEVSPSLGASEAAEAEADTSLGVAPFRRVVASAFAGSFVLFLLVAWSGFATFGDASDSLILNNYASADPLAQVARIGVLLAVVFEFPLLERPFRLTALELLLPVPQETGAITRIASGPAAAIVSVALIASVAATGVPLDTISGLGGCTGGALLIYVAPALMTLKLRGQRRGGALAASDEGGTDFDATTLGLWIVTALGAALAVIGTMDAVQQLA